MIVSRSENSTTTGSRFSGSVCAAACAPALPAANAIPTTVSQPQRYRVQQDILARSERRIADVPSNVTQSSILEGSPQDIPDIPVNGADTGQTSAELVARSEPEALSVVFDTTRIAAFA